MSCSNSFDSFDDLEDYEEDDEFLFQSIQRYNTLQMFNLESIPYHLLKVDDASLCVVSKKSKSENSELLKLKLPRKLTLPPEEEGRSKENDFKVLSGIYIENQVYQIDKIENNNKIITSENNVSGLQVYSFLDSSLGSKNQGQKLEVTSWTEADFTVLQESTQVICSKCCHEPLIQADILSERKVKEIEHPFYTLNILPKDWPAKADPCGVNNVKCEALNTNSIAILNTHTGEVVLHDLRTKDSFVSILGSSDKPSKEIWTLSGCDYAKSSLDYFGILSNATSFCIFDKRKNSVVVQNTGSNEPRENFDNMKLKFSNESDKFSISGMNALVQVYKVNEEGFEHAFTHNGHCPGNLPSVLVTDHIWLQTGGKEYVVSICDNKTLNCWDYKA